MQAQFQHVTTRRTRHFQCGCGYGSKVTVAGIGEGSATMLNAPGTLEKRAAEAAEKDVQLTLAAATCPACGKRRPGGTWRWMLFYFGPVVAVAGFVVFLGFVPSLFELDVANRDSPLLPLILSGVAGVSVIPFVFITWMKWSGVDARVKFETPPR